MRCRRWPAPTATPGRRRSRSRDELAAPGLTTGVGGEVAIDHDSGTQVAEDMGRAESLSMPLPLVVLLVVFGALAAASMPLVVGGLGAQDD
jgi:trehalose monomycolate/heme transporter